MAPPTYDLTFYFRSATKLMIGDIASRTSDPYLVATLHTPSSDRDNDHSPPLRFRTQTEHDTLDPVWDCVWHVGDVPRAGSRLRIEVFDEDVGDHDDLLGHLDIVLGGLVGVWDGDGEVVEETHKLRKRHADKKAAVLNFFTGGSAFRDGVGGNEMVKIGVQVRGETKREKGHHLMRPFTTGPNYWSKHFSPLIGKMVGNHECSGKAENVSFEGTKIQLTGPLPATLSHEYVEFAPFVTSYFTKRGFRGWLLNRALHHQYNNIYSYDRATQYGCVSDDPATSTMPTTALTKKFLELAHWSEGAKVFTYAITLDAEWRFTETGDEFAIDLLSKHSLHSDVSRVIAYSGEFFIRPKPHPDSLHIGEVMHGEKRRVNSVHDHDLHHLELVIDNDSGTYRPKKELLGDLKDFLSFNLPELAIVTYDCFDEELKKLKKHQKELKERHGRRFFKQRRRGSANSSISSGDEEDLERGRDHGGIKQRVKRKIYGGGV